MDAKPFPALLPCSLVAQILGVKLAKVRTLVDSGQLVRDPAFSKLIKIPLIDFQRFCRWHGIPLSPPGPSPLLLLGFRPHIVEEIDEWLGEREQDGISVFDVDLDRFELADALQEIAPRFVAVNGDGVNAASVKRTLAELPAMLGARSHWTDGAASAREVGGVILGWFLRSSLL
jgi:hypothetical protein